MIQKKRLKLLLYLLNIVFTSIVIIFVVPYASHNMAGPLFRFNKVLNQISMGNFAPLTRTRTDHRLKELSGFLEQITKTLFNDFTKIKTVLEEMKQPAISGESTGLSPQLTELQPMGDKYNILK